MFLDLSFFLLFLFSFVFVLDLFFFFFVFFDYSHSFVFSFGFRFCRWQMTTDNLYSFAFQAGYYLLSFELLIFFYFFCALVAVAFSYSFSLFCLLFFFYYSTVIVNDAVIVFNWIFVGSCGSLHHIFHLWKKKKRKRNIKTLWKNGYNEDFVNLGIQQKWRKKNAGNYVLSL